MTVTLRTHLILSVVDADADVVTVPTDEERPKSLATTPVTAEVNVAVNVMAAEVTVAPVAPWLDEKVAVGGLYLEIEQPGASAHGGRRRNASHTGARHTHCMGSATVRIHCVPTPAATE